MLLKLKKKEENQIKAGDLSALLRDSNEKKEFYLLSIRALLQFVKDQHTWLAIQHIRRVEFIQQY